MASQNIAYSWYAVQVKGRQENLVASSLVSKGCDCFLPTYRCRRRWSDRVKELALPLFDGYLFCRLDINLRLPVLMTPGVIRIAGIGKTPIPIAEKEMAAIYAIVLAGANAEPHPYLEIGQKVKIDRGPLADIEGILLTYKNPARLVVSIELLQRSIAVEIDEAWAQTADAEPFNFSYLAGYPNPRDLTRSGIVSSHV
jgi:transcription antitermination factor NusG